MSKYQEDPYGAHSKLLRWAKKGKVVLDVGCSWGYLAEKLSENNIQVIGIDVDRAAINEAKKHCCQVIWGDIEDLKTMEKVLTLKYDVILLADVLEHLKNPAKVLKQIIVNLKRNGEVIISVPNIAFITYRLLHLRGRFEYSEYGIMDKTHLRFYTRKTLEELIGNVGLKIVEFDGVGNFHNCPFICRQYIQ